MPTGHAYVKWNDETDAKLFRAILTMGTINIDYKSIAKVFGADVPASCISKRINKIKKGDKTGGSGSESQPVSTNKRKAGASVGPGNKKAKTVTNVKKEVDSRDEEDCVDVETPHTPPETPTVSAIEPTTPNSGVGDGSASKRSSPRGAKSVNYRELEDPFEYLEARQDEDGNVVFEKESAAGEDHADADQSFDEHAGAEDEADEADEDLEEDVEI